jgi:cardiolipin synthase
MLISGPRRAMINDIYSLGIANGLSTFQIANQNFSLFMNEWNSSTGMNLQQFFNRIASFLPYFGMLITTIITLLSGLRYMISNSRLLKPKHIMIAIRGSHASQRHSS